SGAPPVGRASVRRRHTPDRLSARTGERQITVSLWQRIRTETRGALRSLRYDLRRDLTRARTGVIYPEYDIYSRQPRRLLFGGGVAVLALGGIAGTYFALANGLGGLILGSPSTSTGRP